MNAEMVCGERAEECVCFLSPNHDGPHECGRDGGQWIGTLGQDDFVAVRLPDVARGLS